MRRNCLALLALPISLMFSSMAAAQAPAKKSNIVVIMGDDVGMWNISACHRGMMGGSTPNIGRMAAVNSAANV